MQNLRIVFFLSVGALAACESSTAIVLDGDTGRPDGADADTDADTDADADADSDADSDADTSPPPPVADTSTWTGTQRFSYDYYGYACDETVSVSATRIDESSSTYAAVRSYCSDCTDFYDLSYGQSSVCGWLQLVGYVHGLKLGGTTAGTTVLYPGRNGGYDVYATDPSGSFDGFHFTYDVQIYPYGYELDVQGESTFPEL